MAGNPYTESGERFRIPDMLANRADVYNLGDVLSGRDDLFALSYIENALTSNPVLAPLARASAATWTCWCGWPAATPRCVRSSWRTRIRRWNCTMNSRDGNV